MKKCGKCKLPKDEEEFYRDRRAKDGRRSDCKLCNSAKTKQYRRDNYDKVRAKEDEWHHNNWDYLLNYWSEYRETNREEINQKSRGRYSENREEIIEQTKEYKRRFPGEHNKANRKRKALKYNAPGEGATLEELVEEHGSRCYLCLIVDADSVDHVTPLSRGGTNYKTNLRPVCRTCNSRKHDLTYDEYIERIKNES